jgi:hypothetical protein
MLASAEIYKRFSPQNRHPLLDEAAASFCKLDVRFLC